MCESDPPITHELLEDFRMRLAYECDDAYEQDDVRHRAWVELGYYAGTGRPKDEQLAEDLGGDYICALSDGSIVYRDDDGDLCIAAPGEHVETWASRARAADAASEKEDELV